MSYQYRIRLKNGKVIGPLDLTELKIAVKAQRFSNNDLIQKYPDGEWSTIEDLTEILHLNAEEIELDENKEKTILLKISSLIEMNDNKGTPSNTNKVIENEVNVISGKVDNNTQKVVDTKDELKSNSTNISEDVKDIDPESTQFFNLNNIRQEISSI